MMKGGVGSEFVQEISSDDHPSSYLLHFPLTIRNASRQMD